MKYKQHCPSKESMNLKNKNYLVFFENFSKKDVQEQILAFLDEKISTENIDSIIILGGPSCVNYSQAQAGNILRISENYKAFKEKCLESDRLVTSMLNLYEEIVKKCECLTKKVKHAIVLENPKSRPFLSIRFSKNEILNSKENLTNTSVQLKHPLGLFWRPFLQKKLKKNGGYLNNTLHHWCAYDSNFPKKPTIVLSNLPNLENKPCECAKKAKQRYYKHSASIQNTPGSHLRAIWPPEFVEYIFEKFFENNT